VNLRDAQDDIVISDAVRTPVGRMGGVLAALTAAELATVTLRALVERTGLGEGEVRQTHHVRRHRTAPGARARIGVRGG